MWRIVRAEAGMRKSIERMELVHDFLKRKFSGSLHAKRILSLANGTLGVLRGASLASVIGRAGAQARDLMDRHAVKQVDQHPELREAVAAFAPKPELRALVKRAALQLGYHRPKRKLSLNFLVSGVDELGEPISAAGDDGQVAGLIDNEQNAVSRLGPAASVLADMFDGPHVVVVQVGSNDGVQGDPISELLRRHPEWKTLFIEPLPHIFERLVQNYSEYPNSIFENSAVYEENGTQEFYYVSDEIKLREKDVPYWYDQLGSFDRNHILKHGHKFEEYINTIRIRCRTFQDILDNYNIRGIDILHIDTEGYDFEVLKQVDLERQPPRAILFEFMHLTESDDMAALHLLVKNGYQVQRILGDVLAIRRTPTISPGTTD
jgi:FkbM family methyltransferase